MRPLIHPPIEDITLEGVLYALADPVRLAIVRQLAEAACGRTCTSFQCDRHPLPKSTLSQHFRILRESGLIRSERSGVELRSTLRCAELEEKFGSLLSAILQAESSPRQKTAPADLRKRKSSPRGRRR